MSGAADAPAGLGWTCSAKISSRLSAVPSGTQLMSVSIGLLVSSTILSTSVGMTTSLLVIR